MGFFDLSLELENKTHVYQSICVLWILAERLLTELHAHFDMFRVVLLEAPTVVGQTHVTPVVEALVGLQFCSLFIV